MDSCPIMLAVRSRSSHAKVAQTCCSKNYNATRKEWYYGVKLHAIVKIKNGMLAMPCVLMAATAADHDLPIAKQMMDSCKPFREGVLYADKAYCDTSWKEELVIQHSIRLCTPRKKQKGEGAIHSRDIKDSLISSLRQPVEGFFSCLNRKTGIQDASKVRLFSGLLRKR